MKCYALPRKDGQVEVLQTNNDPAKEIQKLHPKHLAGLTGEIHEIAEAEYRAMPRATRASWRFENGNLIDRREA